ncbi:MAG: DUF192 domain-containing protein [Planctomycetes bacterium]|nr:DUF192 domain-containing protein [Planctomycetota bacterium]MBI3845126.1 DUF192 domain-containing protein [Planctomycetota bacterium]
MKSVRWVPLALVVALLALGAIVFSQCSRREHLEPAVPPGEWATVTFPGKTATAHAEIVYRNDQRMKGLMYRTELPTDTGMLFVFKTDLPQSFWMKNCFMPLSIAYIKSDGRIANILEMAPAAGDPSPPGYDASEPVKYALEMDKGWFAKHGIVGGDHVEFSDEVRRVQPE